MVSFNKNNRLMVVNDTQCINQCGWNWILIYYLSGFQDSDGLSPYKND